MSHESQPRSKELFTEGVEMQQFMMAEMQVLGQLFGDDDTKWVDWLDVETGHGERLRKLLAQCYSEGQQDFSAECVSGVVDTLRHEIDSDERSQIH